MQNIFYHMQNKKKILFFFGLCLARTRRTLQPKPNHMPKTQNAATDNPLKPTFFFL